MDKKQEMLFQYTNNGYELLEDNGTYFTFRKKFNTLAFILLLVFTIIGGLLYLPYHFTKKKLVIKYK